MKFENPPSDQDLRKLIHFSARDGRIWLDDQRMLLMHARALGNLRKDLVQAVGKEHTRRVFMRVGFTSGTHDAALAKRIRPQASDFHKLLVGPQLHMLQGAVQVEPELFEYDPANNHYHGIYRWDHSWEVDAHLREFGADADPACWMLLGYASGYTSAVFDRPIFYKETQCAVCGDAHCTIEGRIQHEWEDGDALAKEYDADSLQETLSILKNEVATLKKQVPISYSDDPLIGQSESFLKAVSLAQKAAPTRVSVLITGETGVGKERFARMIHQMSPRASGPFVAVNCAAIPSELMESELFGVEKGAYTGATGARAGRFERANGGTLLLDEIGELPLDLQAKLLRVLQTGEIDKLGGTQSTKLDVRVLAATHVDLEEAVNKGKFRRDLLYRLNVFPIHIPALRQRVSDIEPLAQHLLSHFCKLHNKRIPGFSDRTIDAMRAYQWPGNVRELENLIERGVIMTESEEQITAKSLFPLLPESSPLTLDLSGDLIDAASVTATNLLDTFDSLKISLPELEQELIRQSVNRAKGNLSAAARQLGISRPQLAYRLQRDHTDS